MLWSSREVMVGHGVDTHRASPLRRAVAATIPLDHTRDGRLFGGYRYRAVLVSLVPASLGRTARRSGLSVRTSREPPSRRARFPQRGIPMHRSSGQNRHARRPALERCEDRILQSIMVEPIGNKATQPQETADTPDSSRFVVLDKATPDHAPRLHD